MSDVHSDEDLAALATGLDVDPSKPRPMIAVLQAKPGQADALRKNILELTRQVRQERGCTLFVPYVSHSDDGRFYLLEVYADLTAFEEHLRTDHVKKFVAAIPSVSISSSKGLVQLDEITVS